MSILSLSLSHSQSISLSIYVYPPPLSIYLSIYLIVSLLHFSTLVQRITCVLTWNMERITVSWGRSTWNHLDNIAEMERFVIFFFSHSLNREKCIHAQHTNTGTSYYISNTEKKKRSCKQNLSSAESFCCNKYIFKQPTYHR